MKIIFAGTPEFAARHLEIVLQSEHEVLSVLTQPDRKSGRGKKINFTPIFNPIKKLNIIFWIINSKIWSCTCFGP